MRILSALFLLGLATCALFETCPSDEEISPCTCENRVKAGEIIVRCQDSTMSLEDLKQSLNSIDGKKNVKLLLHGLTLGKVPPNFFNGTGITTIYIVECEIDNLADGKPSFVGLEDSLKELSINSSVTDEKMLVRFSLGHLQKLEILRLIRNANLKELSNDWLDSALPSLKLLEVSRNGLQIIGDRVFENLTNVFLLQLRDNHFESIKRSMFPDPAEKLGHLLVENNTFTHLPEDIFSNMTSLKYMTLWNNSISRLEQNTWKPVWENLNLISFERNPLVCDSHMMWISELQVPNVLEGKCKYPEERNGMDLLDFIRSISRINESKDIP